MFLPLALLILVFVVSTETAQRMGYSRLSALLYEIYAPLFRARDGRRRRELRTEITKTRAELHSVSSQDEFARWAKVRRKLDKAVAEHERLNSDINIRRAAFEVQANVVLRVLLRGSQAAIVFWNRREAVFYVPWEWFGPATWFLALPWAPVGSVSVLIWFFVCRKTVQFAFDLPSAFEQLAMRSTSSSGPAAEGDNTTGPKIE